MADKHHDLRRGDETMVMEVPTRDSQILVRPKVRLEVLAGPDRGLAVVAEKQVLHVGSQPGNALQLNDEAVSRIHLQITATASGIALKDLGSTNGTWLAGEVRLNEGYVPPGTVIQLGRSQVRIEVLEEQVAESLSPSPGFGLMLGTSPAMRAIFALLERVSPTDETILITGETGTGKELCAHSIVERSQRASGPFIVVDCGAIPPNLLESELFGHVRGAFTGATADHTGAFERAHGGTIFLDEVGELPLELQTRLLRAVENRQMRPVGSTREVFCEMRIIAATNRCLEEEANRGTFRADLYYRLSVVQVRIPPLRERPEDLEVLARHLLLELGVGPERALLDAETLQRMRRYRWPGNVRELRNHLRRLTLGEESLPAPATADLVRADLQLDVSLSFKAAKEAAIERFERAYLEALMQRAQGNISQAARDAQTDRTYLSRLLAKYGIHRG